jgi:hypothetical protein
MDGELIPETVPESGNHGKLNLGDDLPEAPEVGSYDYTPPPNISHSWGLRQTHQVQCNTIHQRNQQRKLLGTLAQRVSFVTKDSANVATLALLLLANVVGRTSRRSSIFSD